MKTLSLKFRFAIGMSIGALALVIGMGAISLHFAQDDLLRTLSAEQLDMVGRVGEDIDSDLRSALGTLAASASALPRDVVADPAKFDTFYASSPALLQWFDEVFIINAKGIVTSTYPTSYAKLKGVDLSDRRYFQRVMAFAKPVISDPLVGKASGLPVIDIAAPILDADGNVVAVMVGVLPLSKRNFIGDYSNTKIGRTGYFTIVTTWPEPVYLAHPDSKQLMQPATNDKSKAMGKLLNATNAASIISTLADGSEALVTYQSLKMSNWVVAAVLPGAEAFETVAHARERTMQVGLVAALIVLPLVWSIAWFLFRPLNTLRRQVEAIAHDPHGRAFATIGRKDEVGEVAIAFNAMLSGQRASEALRLASDQDRRRLVAILESSQDFVAMADVKGRLTYLNASGRNRCGVGLNDDVSHIAVRELFPPWALDRLQNEGVPAALKDGIWLGEMAINDKDGQPVPVDQTVIAHRNVDGRLEFFSSLLHDTSAAQAASIAMRSSEARMLSIADALPVLVAFIDREYRYRFVNSRYEDHFGVDKSKILGKSILEMIGDKAYQVYLPFLERAATGEPQIFEVESHAGLRPVHFFCKLIPQYDDDGRVTGYHFIHQDVTDHKIEHQRLSQLVRADALTGLLNRAGFEVAIAEAMARSQHQLSAMALFYLDVDRFKSINDRYGHLIGDKLLRGFASRLVRAVRSADVAARLGGDEFVVIAEGVRNADDVRSIAGKILLAMRPEFDFNGTTLSITASIGVAIYTGEPIKVDELIRRADAALYRAKDAGRNRYELDDHVESFGTTSLIATSLLGFSNTTTV
jgi:diguanylate cyclase (GGDEF)-like protein/PAS domain S-box-containing protein